MSSIEVENVFTYTLLFLYSITCIIILLTEIFNTHHHSKINYIFGFFLFSFTMSRFFEILSKLIQKTIWENPKYTPLIQLFPDINYFFLISSIFILSIYWYEIYKEIRFKYEYERSFDFCFYFKIFCFFFVIEFFFLTSILTTNIILFYYKQHLNISYLYHYIITCGIFPIVVIFFSFFFILIFFNLIFEIVTMKETALLYEKLKRVHI